MIYKYHQVEHMVAALRVSSFVFHSCGDSAVNLRISIGGNTTQAKPACRKTILLLPVHTSTSRIEGVKKQRLKKESSYYDVGN